jgi:hypothetical protein
LAEKPLHQNQNAYRAGISTETALFQGARRLEKSLNYEEIALGAVLDIEEAFDNTLFNAIITATRERGLEETCCRRVRPMLASRLVHISLIGSKSSCTGCRGMSTRGYSISPFGEFSYR